MIGVIDNDKPRTCDAVMEHLGVVDRCRLIVSCGNDERWTFDFGQPPPAIECHRLLPSCHHQLAILVRDEANYPVGTVPADLLQAVCDDKRGESPHAKNTDEKRYEAALDLLAKGRHVEGIGTDEHKSAASCGVIENQLLRNGAALGVAKYCN